MAKGYNKNKARLDEVRSFGRQLARRSKSRCELCEANQVRLDPVEVLPLPEEPDPEKCAMLCERCAEASRGAKLGDKAQWRFLEGTVWTECAPAQVIAVRVLRKLASDGGTWATDTLDALYLDPEIEAWVDAESLT